MRNCNDGSTHPPRVRIDITHANLFDLLPDFSTVPRGSPEEIYSAVKAAGFEAIQGGDVDVCRKVGLRFTDGARVNAPADAESVAIAAKDKGADCTTLHVAWGMEDDDEVDHLIGAILAASAKHDLPMYVETHRATITQDMWRTVQIAHRHPDLRFNGDFSHWYTGQEMVYGGFDEKLAFIQPVTDRVRFIHGRIGDGGAMQVDIGPGPDFADQPYVEHFKRMWTQSFAGFLRSAGPGDFISFTPELLGWRNRYALRFNNAASQRVETGDRWQQALLYAQLARKCFAAAQLQVEP